MSKSLLDALLDILARWVAMHWLELTGGKNYTGPVTFNFNEGKVNKETIYFRVRAKA